MKKILAALIIVFITITNSQNIYSQKLPVKDVIFLIDLSRSMNENNLFKEVKLSIRDALNKATDKGDNIFIYGFDEKVYVIAEEKIQNKLQAIFKLNKDIADLRANGNWTYITNALEIAAEKLEMLNHQSPNALKIVYLFTDGINDPPPCIKHPITYNNLINKYFSTFKAKNTYTYIFKFGTKKSTKDAIDFADKIGIPRVNPKDFKGISLSVLMPSTFERLYKNDKKSFEDVLHFQVAISKLRTPIIVKFKSESLNLILTKPNQNYKLEKTGQKFSIPYKIKDRKSTRLNSSHTDISRMPSSA